MGVLTDATVDSRLESWARWCRGWGGLVDLGYPHQSPEQMAVHGKVRSGPVIPFDSELEVEIIVAHMSLQSPLHARVIRVEYGASLDCGYSKFYDDRNQEKNARRVGVRLSRYKQALREARLVVKLGLSIQCGSRKENLLAAS